MSKLLEQFDFSKEEDQQEFEKLPKEEKESFIESQEKEAHAINDAKYKKTEDLPNKHQPDFRNVESVFVRGESLSSNDALERSVRIREKLEEPKEFKRANSYEEASLLVEAEIAREKWDREFGDIKDFGVRGWEPSSAREQEALESKNELRRLGGAANSLRYLDLTNNPENTNYFLKSMGKILSRKEYEFFSAGTQEKILGFGEFIIEHGDFFVRLEMLDAYEYLGIEDVSYDKLENIFVSEGEFDLYSKLVQLAKRPINRDKFTKLGEQALINGSPYDAIKSFKVSEKQELLKKAYALEEENNIEAEKKVETMPKGFMTKNLMSHSTSYSNLPDILLKNGILSGVEMSRKGIKQTGGYGNDLQHIWGCFDYVSVWDPWSGYGTRPDHGHKSEVLKQEIEKMIQPYVTRIDFSTATEKEKRDLQNNSIVYYYPWRERTIGDITYYTDYRLTINDKLVTDSRYEGFFEKLNRLYEKATEVENVSSEQPVLYKYDYLETGSRNVIKSAKINPEKYFNSGGNPILLVNPQKKRFPALNSGFGPESFVKTGILPNEIVGFVVPEIVKNDDVSFNYFLKLAKQSNTPFYLSSAIISKEDRGKKFAMSLMASSKTADTQEQYSFEQIWPKKQ